eukprot:GHVN01023780.1.p1 GENE.GHVN01023780.1~~GHVN01023780.1.p1  ORF type:complete len:481 (+),score=121.24 GHVN01023780.1:598-2040(+)
MKSGGNSPAARFLNSSLNHVSSKIRIYLSPFSSVVSGCGLSTSHKIVCNPTEQGLTRKFYSSESTNSILEDLLVSRQDLQNHHPGQFCGAVRSSTHGGGTIHVSGLSKVGVGDLILVKPRFDGSTDTGDQSTDEAVWLSDAQLRDSPIGVVTQLHQFHVVVGLISIPQSPSLSVSSSLYSTQSHTSTCVGSVCQLISCESYVTQVDGVQRISELSHILTPLPARPSAEKGTQRSPHKTHDSHGQLPSGNFLSQIFSLSSTQAASTDSGSVFCHPESPESRKSPESPESPESRKSPESRESPQPPSRGSFGDEKSPSRSPTSEMLSTNVCFLSTGVPAIDLLTPIRRGDKVVLYGPRGTGKSTTLNTMVNNSLQRGDRVITLSPPSPNSSPSSHSSPRESPSPQAPPLVHPSPVLVELSYPSSFSPLSSTSSSQPLWAWDLCALKIAMGLANRQTEPTHNTSETRRESSSHFNGTHLTPPI